MRRSPLGLIALLCLAPVAAAARPVPTPPAAPLPHLQSRARALDPGALVSEAVDHAGLRRILERGRYVGGREREFFGGAVLFDHVTERVLRFGGVAGASSYLRWLREHASDSLGDPVSVTATSIGAGGFVYRPRGCGCHTETPTYLIAWRRGRDALTVLAAGRGATAKTTGALARSLDRAVS